MLKPDVFYPVTDEVEAMAFFGLDEDTTTVEEIIYPEMDEIQVLFSDNVYYLKERKTA